MKEAELARVTIEHDLPVNFTYTIIVHEILVNQSVALRRILEIDDRMLLG
jgi:hypothetical protein